MRLYKSDYPSSLFEIVWRDFEVFLKDTHTLELLNKAKKKLLKKKWKKLGYGGNEKPIWGDAMRLLLESRLKLLEEGEKAKPLSRVVGHRPLRKKLLSKTPKQVGQGRAGKPPGSGASTPLVSDDEDEEMEDLDDLEVDDFGYYVERETFNDQKKLPDVRFCNRYIFNRTIFSRWIRVTDMRVGEAHDSDEDESSSKDSYDSDGESKKEDVAESKEGKAGSEDGSKVEDGEEEVKADSDASDDEEEDDDNDDDDDEDDLGSIKSSEPDDDESSDMDSMSDLDDDEVKSVYLQITVHQREWRLFIVAYEPSKGNITIPNFPRPCRDLCQTNSRN